MIFAQDSARAVKWVYAPSASDCSAVMVVADATNAGHCSEAASPCLARSGVSDQAR